MKTIDFISEGKITNDGLQELDNIIKENKQLKSAFAYKSHYSVFEGPYNTYYSREEFKNKIDSEEKAQIRAEHLKEIEEWEARYQSLEDKIKDVRERCKVRLSNRLWTGISIGAVLTTIGAVLLKTYIV